MNERLAIGILERSTTFGVNIVKFANQLPKTPAGFALSSQLIRSGTSIGANLHEAKSAFSKKDFIHCVAISLKEARETYYWLTIIQKSEIVKSDISLLFKENDEIIRILFTIIKNTKSNLYS